MADAGAGWANVGLQAAALAANVLATGLKIDEGIADYEQALLDVQARRNETVNARNERVARIKEEGVATLREQGAQNAFEAKTAITAAELVAGAEESRLGRSGLQQRGSPLLAAQQNVDLAYAAADRSIEAAGNALTIGGLRLSNTIKEEKARTSVLTQEFGRQEADLTRKRDELSSGKAGYLLIAAAGGMASLGHTWYSQKSQGWQPWGSGQ